MVIAAAIFAAIGICSEKRAKNFAGVREAGMRFANWAKYVDAQRGGRAVLIKLFRGRLAAGLQSSAVGRDYDSVPR
jgi:hypothetical protein